MVADLSETKDNTRKSKELMENKLRNVQALFDENAVEINDLMRKNEKMKESVLDIQMRSMRDNLIFSGIQEYEEGNTE
ncbi:hypothetical protein FSP39_022141 [Pinctada imbricata]|uniref:Uncharacterized protein n=1 Tax=Pinctada imbricata TaxID=66713 RepID=A0AA89C0U0_PINIB|nr:hypothetical protein FSP39_022141 [Pinctada imbricata]